MFYKVLKNGKVIDVLNQLIYLKYQPKHQRMLLCTEEDAQGILSSDQNEVWHEETLYKIPVPGYETVKIEEIDEHEYKQLKMLNGKTPEEIVDAFVLTLINEGVI